MEKQTGATSETRVLKVPPDSASEAQELTFELDFFQGLTAAQRFELMFERSRQMVEALEAHGHRAPASILKRT